MNICNTTHLLDCLGEFTTTRDVDLLDIGLIRTLTEILDLPSVSLLKSVKDDGSATKVTYHHVNAHVSVDDELLSETFLSRLCEVKAKKTHIVSRDTGKATTIFPTFGSCEVIGYIVIHTEHSLPPQQAKVVDGILLIYQNYYKLLNDAQTDKLTGLLNRKTFDESFDKIFISICKKSQAGLYPNNRRRAQGVESYWLAVMDIDHFKQVNDTFGHICGDEVLLTMSQLMKRCFREEDLLFRFGGEEFVIILSLNQDDPECARNTLERFRATVASYDFPLAGKVTISIGTVKIHGQAFPANLLGMADQALYYAKQHGRNRVCFFEELLDAGEIQTSTSTAGEIELF